jgi:hypothetical protein
MTVLKSRLSPTAFGNQTISSNVGAVKASRLRRRLMALRPYLAAGLPLSCTIVALRKIVPNGIHVPISSTSIKTFLPLFVNHAFPAFYRGISALMTVSLAKVAVQ